METIEELLKQAVTQHKIIELNTMFAKNMEFFKQVLPNIYEQFKNYNPTEIKIVIQDDGSLDLANVNLDNRLVYGCDPVEFARKTVEEYVKRPLAQRLNPDETFVLNMDGESHTPNLNAIIRYLKTQNTNHDRDPLDERTDFMFMLGIGLGYQITELLKHTELLHLTIAETNLDIFYASLHTLDWVALNEVFDAPNKTLNIVLGQTTNTFIQMMTHHVQQIGVFNFAKPYIYTHLSSKELTDATTNFIQQVPIMIGALGYFDDEKIGLTHSINNVKNKVPFMKNHGFLQGKLIDKPVFLIANGPSLDIAKDFIRENRNKAILVSCGTALSSLYKLDIKPDFHVELERANPTKEWIEVTTPQEFRDGITLLAVNTVHPDLAKLFNRTGMALKYNDLGGTYIENFMSDDAVSVTLGACNPIVSNAGLSFCAALGFTNIYLFGLDLGFPAGNKHHSSMSFHYDIKDEDIDSFQLALPEDEEDYKIPGNFGETIISNQLFYRSKITLEALLADCKAIECKNTSLGAKIEYTTAVRVEDIDTKNWDLFDKKDFINKLYSEYFSNKQFKKFPKESEIVKSFYPAINVLKAVYEIFDKPADSYDDGMRMLQENQDYITKFSTNPKTADLTKLIKGSSDAYSLVLALCLLSNNKKNGLETFNYARTLYQKYLASAQQAIKNNLLENDYTAFHIEQKLKKQI